MRNREEVLQRITEYLGNGGLFNPECMEHDKVRDLLIDCRDLLQTTKESSVGSIPEVDFALQTINEKMAIRYPHTPTPTVTTTQGDEWKNTLISVRVWAGSYVPSTRLIGNITADEILMMCDHLITHLPVDDVNEDAAIDALLQTKKWQKANTQELYLAGPSRRMLVEVVNLVPPSLPSPAHDTFWQQFDAQVTDEMVEAACLARFGENNWKAFGDEEESWRDFQRKQMRKALTAAQLINKDGVDE